MDFFSLAIGLLAGAALYGLLAELQDRLGRRRAFRPGPLDDRPVGLRGARPQLRAALRAAADCPGLLDVRPPDAGLRLDPRVGYRVTPEAAHLGREAERRERFRRDLATRGLEVDELSIGER